MNKILIIMILITGCISSFADESICYGTAEKGSLEGGVELPRSGPNFEAYSYIGRVLSRTFLHSKVQKIVVDTYRKLEMEAPGKLYKFGETGNKEGGPFWPHKTHQNGLSVDFMVPVVNENGKSVQLPTNILNKWGYGIEFDDSGRYDEYEIDFESMAIHLVWLHKTASAAGVGIRRVIFDPKLQKKLLKTRHADYLKQNLTFSKKRSWVRHDEHYHVDFVVQCKKRTR